MQIVGLAECKNTFVAGEISHTDSEFVNEFSQGNLCNSLCRFIWEVRKLTLREIIVIQAHIHQSGLCWMLLNCQLRNILGYEREAFAGPGYKEVM